MATFPLWCPTPLGQLATPELRHSLVHELKNPDESIRLQTADLLGDFGTAEEIPALETALKKAQQSGDQELEQKCERALKRIRRR
jgi:HEAT repeat protein